MVLTVLWTRVAVGVDVWCCCVLWTRVAVGVAVWC